LSLNESPERTKSMCKDQLKISPLKTSTKPIRKIGVTFSNSQTSLFNRTSQNIGFDNDTLLKTLESKIR
jgi:hypothetical protein